MSIHNPSARPKRLFQSCQFFQSLVRLRRVWFGLVGLSVVGLHLSALQAQTRSDGGRLDTVVVTASRAAQQVADALPHTTVITRADIEASQAEDVLTLLRQQAGIDMAQSGGMGATASVFLRGTNSNQVLLLIDGVPFNAVGSGIPAWAHLLLDQVERIEIVRGNVSALYGSQAVGGVVQVFTRGQGSQSGVQARIDGGSHGQVGLNLAAQGAFGAPDTRTEVGLSFARRQMRGFSAIDADRVATANPDKDGYRNDAATLRFLQRVGEHEFGVSWLETRSRRDFDDSIDYSFDPGWNGRTVTHEERSQLRNFTAHARLRLAPAWESRLQFGDTRDLNQSSSSYPGSFVTGRSESRGQQWSWQNVWSLDATRRLTAGVETLEQQGTDTQYAARFMRRAHSLMAGYQADFARHSVQANVRHDRYSDFGNASTGLLAWGYRFNSSWKGIAQISTAFKAPTFNELYYPFFGNPALQPEHARSMEVGVLYTPGGAGPAGRANTEGSERDYFRASLYRTRVKDLIVFDPAIGVANNIDSARLTGLELAGRIMLDGWLVNGNFAWQDPRNLQTGQTLARRAARHLNLDVSRRVGPWRLGLGLEAVSARRDADIVTFAPVRLSGFALMHVRARYLVNRVVSLDFGVRNVFDRDHEWIHGYNTPGREWRAGLSVKM